jgi:hypothetical protein
LGTGEPAAGRGIVIRQATERRLPGAVAQEAAMGHVIHHAHFDAPIDIVFSRAIDPTLMSRVMPHITRVWDIQGPPDEVGSSFRFREHRFGRDTEGRVDVIAVDRPTMHESLTTYDNGIRVHWFMRATSTPDGGTDGTDEIDFELPPRSAFRLLGSRYLERAFEQTLEDGARRLQSIIDAERVPTG